MDINKNQQINTFTKGMNTDTSDAYLPSEQYRYAQNVRLTTNNDSNSGELRLIEGTAELFDRRSIMWDDIVSMTSCRNMIIFIASKTILRSGAKVYNIFKFDVTQDEPQYIPLFKYWQKQDFQNVSMVARFENDKTQKLYIADGVHQIRIVDLIKTEQIPSWKSSQIGETAGFSFLQAPVVTISTGGALKPAKVQYVYRFGIEGGEFTRLSSLSSPVSLYANDTYNLGYRGESSDGNTPSTDKMATITINQTSGLDISQFNKMQVFRITYKNSTSLPVVEQIYDDTPVTEILDIGSDGITISLEELSAMGFDKIIPKILESKDNYLFAANGYDVADDVDSQFVEDIKIHTPLDDPNSNASKYIWDDNEWPEVNGEEWIDGEYFSVKFITNTRRIAKDNRSLDKIAPRRTLRRGEVYRYAIILFDKLGRRSKPKWLCDLLVPNISLLNGNKDFVDIGISIKQNKIIKNAIGYEVVRAHRTDADKITLFQGIFGYSIKHKDHINAFNYGILTPRLISDGPNAIRTQGNLSFEDQHELYSSTEDHWKSFDKLAIFACPEQCYRPNYVEDIIKGKNLYVQSAALYKYQNNYDSGDGRKNYMDFVNTIDGDKQIPVCQTAHISNITDTYRFFKGIKDKQGTLGTININGVEGINISYSFFDISTETKITLNKDFIENKDVSDIRTVSSINLTEQPFSSGENWDNAEIRAEDDNVSITIDGTAYNFINWSLQGIDFTDTEGKTWQSQIIARRHHGSGWDWREHPIYGSITAGGYGLLLASEKGFGMITPKANSGVAGARTTEEDFIDTEGDQPSSPSQNHNNSGNSSNQNLTNTDVGQFPIAIVNLRVKNPDPYRRSQTESFNYSTFYSEGNLFSAMTNDSTANTHEPSDEFQHITDEDPQEHSNTVSHDIFDGDTYGGMFTYHAGHLWDDQYMYNCPKHGVVYTVPVESSIDLAATYGDLYTRIEESKTRIFVQDFPYSLTDRFKDTSYNYTQEKNAYLYNDGYSAAANAIEFHPIKYSSVYSKEFDSRIWYSNAKENGSSGEDQWLLFQNHIDADTRYGQITNMKLFKGKLFFWQEHAMGALSINEKVMLPKIAQNDGDIDEIMLGTGNILDRCDYITTLYGMKFGEFSDTQSDSALYWWDSYNKELLQYSGNIAPLTKIKYIRDYINDNNAINHPMLAYNPKYDEILASVVSDNTVVYNELAQAFTSIYTFQPTCGITVDGELYLTDGKQLYIMNRDSNGKSTLFGKDVHPYIEYVINDQSQYTKTFDIQTFNMSGDKDQLQFTYNTPLKQDGRCSGKNVVTDRELDYRLNIPRAGRLENDQWVTGEYGDRLRGKTMRCTISSDSNSTDFSLQYIITKYRMSWS